MNEWKLISVHGNPSVDANGNNDGCFIVASNCGIHEASFCRAGWFDNIGEGGPTDGAYAYFQVPECPFIFKKEGES